VSFTVFFVTSLSEGKGLTTRNGLVTDRTTHIQGVMIGLKEGPRICGSIRIPVI
jgi:hypothetical protein